MRFSARSSFILSVLAIAAVMGVFLYMASGKRAELAFATAPLRHPPKVVASPSTQVSNRTLEAAFGHLPMQFEANQGQADSRVKFLAHGQGYSLFLTRNKTVLSLRKGGEAASKPAKLSGKGAAKPAGEHAVLQMSLEGANPNPQTAGRNPLPGHVNYFIGKDPSKWHADIPTYSQVAYQGVYQGVDEVFYGNQQQLEYDFTVAPGADAGCIAMRVDGASFITRQADGSLRLAAGDSAMQLRAPVIYQGAGAQRKLIAGNYDLKGNEIRFHVGSYDHNQPLVIDPMLVYSTFLGGSLEDQILAGRIDSSGNFYVTGYTFSNFFPLANAFQSSNIEFANGNPIAFVSELSAAGNNLVFSTYLGGSGQIESGPAGDEGEGIALNPSPSSGAVIVAGQTFSVDFPITVSAFQSLNGGAAIGAQTGFLTVLNAGGNGLLYSTYLGGNNGDIAFGVAADSAGNAYIAGATASINFPIVAGAPEPNFVSSTFEGFLSKINTTLSGQASLIYSTFLGGTGNSGNGDGDEVFSVRTDGNGNVFFGGLTSSTDFLTTAGITSAYQLTCKACPTGGFDGFLGEANTNVGGSGFTYLTYLGGSTQDEVLHVDNDANGNLYATGAAFSADFPVTTGAFQSALQNTSGGSNAFVTEMNPTGTALVYSTYLGGSNVNGGTGDVGLGIGLDPAGNAYVTGQTSSTNFPLANPIQSTNLAPSGSTNVFVTEVNPTGSGLVFSTYLGGSSNSNSINFGDTGWGIEVDANNAIYVAGTTGSPHFPTFPTGGAFQTGFGGFDDGFLTKISALSNTVGISPNSLAIYSSAVGTSASSAPATLTNGTTSSITLSSLTITGTNASDFSLSSSDTCTMGGTVAASGGTCMITVNYTPTSANSETAELTIVFNSPSSPIVVQLTGAVGSFNVTANPGSLNLMAGQSGTTTITVSAGSQGFSGDVTLVCSGAPSGSSCSVSPGSVMLTGTGSATATATITTSAQGFVAPPPSGSPRSRPWLPVGTMALAALLGLGFVYTKRLSAFGQTRYQRVSVLALIAALLLVGGMTACNGSSSSSGGGGTPPGTYTLTVTGTAGNLMPTTMVTLNVQ